MKDKTYYLIAAMLILWTACRTFVDYNNYLNELGIVKKQYEQTVLLAKISGYEKCLSEGGK